MAIPEEYDHCAQGWCTPNLNQHLPQYCGSCWAHAAISSLQDRIKRIRVKDRKDFGPDITLSVQHILNCPLAEKDDENSQVGSCWGGSTDSAYALIKHRFSTQKNVDDFVAGRGLAYSTENPYLACSSDSTEGFCEHIKDSLLKCVPENIARNCDTFAAYGGSCQALPEYPNLKIDAYGTINTTAQGTDALKLEILHRGPVSCGVDANYLVDYATGIIALNSDPKHPYQIDHVVSIVGWGKQGEKEYWIGRNSWGEYWGERGFFRSEFGAMALGEDCAWGNIKSFTVMEKVHYSEEGQNIENGAL
eukprot:CAMPEP_0170175298 /NCGR_PEP_ID=MMETSP0040_2-20121228/8399_1 /TAXON_ID=641309 /ORGANISM="Lotharella oceanica, Strain CCMP622" /LENGTH=304 /DNA_ID=CAMNT_0010417231 /DNA_START=1 /DNA_END=915 /DNA_ORIENTATION=+